MANCLENFKLLYTLSEEVGSFTRECCREEWLHAALTLSNVSELVSLLGFNLRLWSTFVSTVSLKSQQSLTLREVDSIYTSEVETVKAKASLDEKTLSASLNAVLRSTKRSSSEHKLAAFVLDRLGSNLKPTDELAGSSQTSFSQEVLRNLKNQKKRHLLGKGASAQVYSLTWSGAEFAVKTFFGKEDFDREVSVLRNLFHPNIVSVLCYAKEKHKCSIVMEKMDEDLHSFMQARLEENSPPFGILEGVDIMLQIGRGIRYLHGLKIAHRDLKSSNILVRTVKATELEVEYVMVKVADFGLSKTDLKSMTYTPQTFNMGTARWMAPELIKFLGAENTTECETPVKNFPFKCDIYSFAIVCYEILTGEHRPFADIESNNEVKKLVLGGTRPVLPAGCPEKLKHLIERCWSANAEARPNFGEICAELQHLKYLLTSCDMVAVYDSLAMSMKGKSKKKMEKQHARELAHQDITREELEDKLRGEIKGLNLVIEELSGQLSDVKVRLAAEGIPYKPTLNENTGPNFLTFLSVLFGVRDSAHTFSETFMSYLKQHLTKARDLDEQICLESEVIVARPSDYKFLIQSFIVRRMFLDFDSGCFNIDTCMTEIFDIEEHSRACFQEYMTYGNVANTVTLLTDNRPHSAFLREFCFKKFLHIVSESTEEAFFGDFNHSDDICAGRHPSSRFYESYCKLAVSVWLLHRLAFSFQPPVRMISVRKGAQFNATYMESAVPRVVSGGLGDGGSALPFEALVGLMVHPGFRVGSRVIPADVYLATT